MASRCDQSEKKKKNNNNTSSQTVPLAEHKILKEQYESLMIEHESLIKTLELLEKQHGFTVDDLVDEQREEALVGKEVVEKWDKMFSEMQKKLKTVEKDIEYMISVDETEMNGVDSGSGRSAENTHVDNNASNEDVIAISDEDEENQRESNGRHSNSSQQNPFIL